MPSCKYLTAIKISVCGKKSQQDLKRVGVYVRMLKDVQTRDAFHDYFLHYCEIGSLTEPGAHLPLSSENNLVCMLPPQCLGCR